ncbi:non-homologous end-joining DNA ligase [Gudongella sp. DL1XJH-153]|uniref:non-homologous end-joining DNA ligase n=1 Tax=Gudongella sp. DL1XJH-153 TaxID=3409804 RepID=UPI003BB5C908
MIDIREVISENEESKLTQNEMPDWIEPMLATLTHNPFSEKGWLYERKFDGERCLAFKSGDDLQLMSRNKKDLKFRYPEIADALSSMNVDSFIVDGEIVAFDGTVTSFSRLQKRMHVSSMEEAMESDVEVYYYVFDIMYADKYDLTDLPLRERKKVLKRILDFQEPIRYTIHQNENGLEYLQEACNKQWEGLIAKKSYSQYLGARSKKWLKFKCSKSQEFIIMGYTDPKGERIGFGALIMGYYENDRLKYAGRVGTGYNDDFLKELSEKLKRIETDHSFLDDDIPGNGIHWVEPKFVGEVSFNEWTDDGRLRHPSFKGLRDDKDPKDVVNENLRAKKGD